MITNPTGLPTTSIQSLRLRQAVSSLSWDVPGIGIRPVCARGCRTPMVMASTLLKPQLCLLAATKARLLSTKSWDVNYGQGGIQNGGNIAFTVPGSGFIVTFSYDSVSHILSISMVSTGSSRIIMSNGMDCGMIPVTFYIVHRAVRFLPARRCWSASAPSTMM